MTYCVGVRLTGGIVLLSDTRTNAGVDNVSRYRKMFTWEVPGERVIAMVTAGNLSMTQGVITSLNDAIRRDEAMAEGGKGKRASGNRKRKETILNAATMFRVAQLVGDAMREQQTLHRETLQAQGAAPDASVIVAGQRRGGRHRLFLVYSAGNFIEATEDTPFFQIGEHKYGKPILDRVITPETQIGEALKAVFVSMDSTLRSNLSVGMPLDLAVFENDTFGFRTQRRIEQNDGEFGQISQRWSNALRRAFRSLPDVGG